MEDYGYKIYRHPEIKEKFIHAIRKGATYRLACMFAGISEQTFYDYRTQALAYAKLPEEQQKGHKDKGLYDFLMEVYAVEGEAAMIHLDKIENAADIQWQAAAWKLERRHPKDFGANAYLQALEDRIKQLERGDSGNEEDSKPKNCE